MNPTSTKSTIETYAVDFSKMSAIKKEAELLKQIPKHLLEDWNSYLSKSPNTRLQYLDHQYKKFTQEAATISDLETSSGVPPIQAMAATSTNDDDLVTKGLLPILGDLAWATPYGPFISAGFDALRAILGPDSSTSNLDNMLKSFDDAIKGLKNDIQKLENEIEENKIKKWQAKIGALKDTLKNYLNGLKGITDQVSLKTYVEETWEIEKQYDDLLFLLNAIPLESELIKGDPYSPTDFSRALARLNLYITACALRSGYANLNLKKETIINSDLPQLIRSRFNDLNDFTSENISNINNIVNIVKDRIVKSAKATPTTTPGPNNLFIIDIASDGRGRDVDNKPTMGIINYSHTITDSLFYVNKRDKSYRITTYPNSVGLQCYDYNTVLERSDYSLIEVSDCLGGNTKFFYDATSQDDEFSSGGPFPAVTHKESFSDIYAKIYSQQELDLRKAATQAKADEIANNSLKPMNPFSTLISQWATGMVPSDPTQVKIGNFTGNAVDNTYWKLPKTNVSYGVQYMNAVGTTSSIVWSEKVDCSGKANPQLSGFKITGLDQDQSVAVIQIHRKFEQNGRELNNKIVCTVTRTESKSTFPTDFIDNDPGTKI